jgi:hypothetical protein
MGAFPQRILVSHAPPEAYAAMTRPILAKLGYVILLPEEFEAATEEAPNVRAALRIVDERQLQEVPEDPSHVPILVLTGRHGVTGADPRIVGAIRRPAGMHELYRLIQQVTEDTPRSTPRIPTHITAHCRREGREWSAAMLSLSENGCLLRSPEPLMLGSRFEVSFSLPREGAIEVQVETAYQLLPDVGLVFHGVPTRHRDAIVRFVTASLLLGETGASPQLAG